MARQPTKTTTPAPITGRIRIRAVYEGVYCCGVVHTVAERTFAPEHFTVGQRAELAAHPDLSVEIVKAE